jgi:hypothetical protein
MRKVEVRGIRYSAIPDELQSRVRRNVAPTERGERGIGADGSRFGQTITVETSENMQCTFTVQVENHSDRDVTLGDVRAVVMGPDTGSVIKAETIDGHTPRGDEPGIDAVHALDRSVPAGASAAFDIVAVFNPEGCNDGGTLKLYQFPQVHVSALGEDRVIGGPLLAFHNTIHTPGCDAP